MKGVTQRVYTAWRKANGRKNQHVKFISNAELEAIYRDGYWDKTDCEDRPAGADLAVFDAAVNSGPGRALAWVKPVNGDTRDWIKAYCARRLGFVRGLKTWATFGKGWSRRIADVEAQAVKMWLGTMMRKEGIADELSKEAEKAQGSADANGKKAGGVTTGGAVVATGEPLASGGSDYSLWIAAGVAVVVALAVAYYLSRRSHDRERAAAYKAVA